MYYSVTYLDFRSLLKYSYQAILLRAPRTSMRLMVTPQTEAVSWKVMAVRPVSTEYSGQNSAVVQMCRYGCRWRGKYAG